MVLIPHAEHEKYLAQEERLAGLEKQIEMLMEVIHLSRQKQFGSSYEKLHRNRYERLSMLFNEAETCLTVPLEKDTTTVSAYIRQKCSSRIEDILPANVPVEVMGHRTKEKELQCLACEETMEEIGKEIRRTLVSVPAQLKLREDWYYSYTCRRCTEEAKTLVVKTEKSLL